MFTPDNDDGLTYEGLLPLDNPGDQHGWRTDYYCGLSGLTFTTTQTSLLRLIISGPVYTPSCQLYLGLRQEIETRDKTPSKALQPQTDWEWNFLGRRQLILQNGQKRFLDF